MNLIFTAFATLEGYREGSNANLGSEVFYRCIVVSLVSAKQKNQNCDAALVTNTAVPVEPFRLFHLVHRQTTEALSSYRVFRSCLHLLRKSVFR